MVRRCGGAEEVNKILIKAIDSVTTAGEIMKGCDERRRATL